MKRLGVILTVLLSAQSLLIAQKADFASAEKFRTANLRERVGDLEVKPNWIHETNKFWYSYKTPDGKFFYYVDAPSGKKRELFNNRYMASEIHKLIHRPFNERDLPIKKLKFEEKSNTDLNFMIDSIKFGYNINTRKLIVTDTVSKKEERTRWATYSPDSTWIAFAKNHNLYIMRSDDPDSVEIQLTTDGMLNYGYDASRNIDTTTNKRVRSIARWFKNEQKIYMVKSDRRKVGELFVINSLKNPRPELETYKYSMPGEENVPQNELVIIDIDSKKKLDVDVDKWKDQRLDVRWTSQESADRLIIERKKRDLTELEICMVDANTGELKVLFGETQYPYIYDGYGYGRLSVLNEGDDIIWWSERSGWGQLYLYDSNGNLKRQLTDGYFVAGEIEQIDTIGRQLYISAFGREEGIHPYYNMYYSVSLDKPGMSLLTPDDASHSFSMSKTSDYFVDTYSRVDMVPTSVLRDNKGKVIMELETPDLSALYETGWQLPERIVIKAKDGVTDLYGVIYKPFKFEEGRKYPIISYVYPGPQTEGVPYTFTVNGRYNVALAQLGFVVVNFGHRGGSPQRNNYYHTYGYDNLRDYALADDKYGIEQLADRYSFIDITKVGIYGHSGGGFMSTAALLTYPDFYDVAVSSSGNHDNNIYNQWWGETHHGVKEVEKSSKKKKNGEDSDSLNTVADDAKISFKSKVPVNQDLVKNLKGHLLLVHGDMDNNVHPGNSIRVADALIKANKRFDFMVMPGQRHGYGSYSPYFERLMWYYFAEHLLGDYRTNVGLLEF